MCCIPYREKDSHATHAISLPDKCPPEVFVRQSLFKGLSFAAFLQDQAIFTGEQYRKSYAKKKAYERLISMLRALKERNKKA